MGQVQREEIAQRARRYLEGALGFEEFMRLAPEQTDDDDIAELVDLIEHEPKRGGFLGASEREYVAHMTRIRELVDKLSS